MNASAFSQAMIADGPAADRAGKMHLYGWLIGSWDIDVTRFLPDGTTRQRPGEWHFAWVLEGRAIQDVWVVPPRGVMRQGDAAANMFVYGTTLRTFDPRSGDWHIQWTDPVTQSYVSMIGRREGEDIVQIGKDSAGMPNRWSFSGITPNSFRWRGETAADDGATWKLNVEFLARRTA